MRTSPHQRHPSTRAPTGDRQPHKAPDEPAEGGPHSEGRGHSLRGEPRGPLGTSHVCSGSGCQTGELSALTLWYNPGSVLQVPAAELTLSQCVFSAFQVTSLPRVHIQLTVVPLSLRPLLSSPAELSFQPLDFSFLKFPFGFSLHVLAVTSGFLAAALFVICFKVLLLEAFLSWLLRHVR